MQPWPTHFSFCGISYNSVCCCRLILHCSLFHFTSIICSDSLCAGLHPSNWCFERILINFPCLKPAHHDFLEALNLPVSVRLRFDRWLRLWPFQNQSFKFQRRTLDVRSSIWIRMSLPSFSFALPYTLSVNWRSFTRVLPPRLFCNFSIIIASFSIIRTLHSSSPP